MKAKLIDDKELMRYAVFGRAALIPGLQTAVEVLQRHLDNLRADLAAFQGMEAEPDTNGTRKPKAPAKQGGSKYGWDGMSAEERSAEMQRRMGKRKKKRHTVWDGMTTEERSAEMKRRRAVAKQKQTAKLHPRDKDHPDHEEWRESIRKAQKARWAKKTRAQKDAWAAKMQAGKTAKLSLAS